MNSTIKRMTMAVIFRTGLLGLAGAVAPCAIASAVLAYRNPIVPGNLADPAVLRHDGVYYLYGTGEVNGDNGTRVYTSTNLYHQKRHDRVEWDRFICIDPLWFDREARLYGRASRGTSEPGPVVAQSSSETIDAATLDRWSAPYRGWHYWPEHVVPARPTIGGITNLLGTDVPTVYQLPGSDKYFMSFIGFDGQGYQSFVAESEDLLHWGEYRLAMGYGPAGEFDHGGCVIGAFLYESYDIKAPRVLKQRDGTFWTLYGAYPRQGGYELRPGYEGVAVSDDGLTWRRAKPEPILSVHDPDCAPWERDCIYQPWLVEHQGRFFNFYNAANGGTEQTGLAFSTDLLNWMRYPANPVVRTRPDGFDAKFSSDPKVFRDGDHWTMFYFGVGRGGAHIMIAFSRDLAHWTAHPEPLYRAGGNPSGLDKQYAHKISLIYNEKNDTFYLFYNAVPGKADPTGGRGIGLIGSRPLR